jgi:hypothetical protein
MSESNSIDPHAMAQRVIRRDRWRIGLLGAACVVAWMLVVMMPWATILPMLARIMEHQMDISSGLSQQQRDQTVELARIVKVGTLATFFGSIASMLLAAVCTMLLITFSRRSTLRQVNARLSEISAQLKLLSERSK